MTMSWCAARRVSSSGTVCAMCSKISAPTTATVSANQSPQDPSQDIQTNNSTGCTTAPHTLSQVAITPTFHMRSLTKGAMQTAAYCRTRAVLSHNEKKEGSTCDADVLLGRCLKVGALHGRGHLLAFLARHCPRVLQINLVACTRSTRPCKGYTSR